jgi:acyl carrier protein
MLRSMNICGNPVSEKSPLALALRTKSRGRAKSIHYYFSQLMFIDPSRHAGNPGVMEVCKMSAGSAVQERVISLVTGILSANSIVVDVLPGSRLADIGMTSMDMVNLMLAVEAEFDMTIPQADITPENFQSPESIERLVARQSDSVAA